MTEHIDASAGIEISTDENGMQTFEKIDAAPRRTRSPRRKATTTVEELPSVEVDEEVIAAQAMADKALEEARLSSIQQVVPQQTEQAKAEIPPLGSVGQATQVTNNVVVNEAPVPQQTQPAGLTMIDKTFIQKMKTINSIPDVVLQQRLDEIDALFSLRRNGTPEMQNHASILLVISLWDALGLK